jgi:hypothetical protein
VTSIKFLNLSELHFSYLFNELNDSICLVESLWKISDYSSKKFSLYQTFRIFFYSSVYSQSQGVLKVNIRQVCLRHSQGTLSHQRSGEGFHSITVKSQEKRKMSSGVSIVFLLHYSKFVTSEPVMGGLVVIPNIFLLSFSA